jgi:hypothetical protein
MTARDKLEKAFPNPHLRDGSGLTIQDYIAIKVLCEFIKNNDTTFEEDCEMAYVVADKMMKERNARYPDA